MDKNSIDKYTIYQAGEQIRDLVQNAVESQDFSQLSKTISDVINQAADGLEDLVKETVADQSGTGTHKTGKTATGTQRTGKTASWGDRYRAPKGSEAADRIKQQLAEQRKRQAENGQVPIFQVRRAPGLVSGRVQQVIGYSGMGLFGLTTMLVALAEQSINVAGEPPIATLFMGGIFAISAVVGITGRIKVGRAKRFQRYEDIMGDRTFIEVRELADATGKTVEYVRKDLSKMIEKGFFPHGHLDQTGNWLMTTQESYQQYLAAQKSYEQRSRQSREAAETKKTAQEPAPAAGAVQFDEKNLSPESRKLIEEGNRYIAYIHECNDRLPGKEISDKLDRLEQVITRIFQEVARRPKLAPELRKMMSYYLPTTQKLLDAYCALDEQHVSGTNIDKTKREIEEALDTINKAFENLLDGFFEHTSWDISSDISVLNTMFAQEGLTGDSIRDQVGGSAASAGAKEDGQTGTEQKTGNTPRKPELSFGAAQTAGHILDAMGGAAAAAPEPDKE